MYETGAGFHEIEHTADWEIHVWAPDLADLFEQAARGMYSISGMQISPDNRQSRQIDLHASDAESLLVRFLSELLYLGDEEKIAFDRFALQLDSYNLHAVLQGGELLGRSKEIKAVTYHRLNIRPTSNGLEVNIVFDV